ncbi:MAG: transglycosylase domain-containing protein [Myxococcales bacterium]|nr:transglycosylase domain-containing protein [Myxococcales bacterium]MCB9583225.1 transglycosylase domain-containing protein [Polyangiaceae bacterium]
MRRSVKIALFATPVALATLAGGFAPMVRAKAEAKAEARGATLTVGSVRPGAGRVWLRDVVVHFADIPALETHLDAIEVNVTPSLGVRSVAVHGGTVVIRGSAAELREQISAWRQKRGASSKGGTSSTTYTADGLRLVWHDAEAGGPPQRVWGLAYRRSDAGERITADLARVDVRGVRVEALKPAVELARKDGRRVLERLSAESVLATLDLDGAAHDLMPADGPTETSPTKPAQQLEPAKGAKDKTALGAKSRLRRLIALAPERGPKIRRAFDRVAQLAAVGLPASGELDLSGLRLKLRRNGETLNLGPARLRVKRDEQSVHASLVPGEQAKQPVRVDLSLPLGEGEVEIKASGGPIGLSLLGIQEGDLGLTNVEGAQLEIRSTAVLSADGKKLRGFGSGKLTGLGIDKRWLASKPVSGIDFGWRGRGEVQLDGSRMDIQEGELDVGKVRMDLKGYVERFLEKDEEQAKIVLEGGVPLASCQSMLDSTPEGLAPLLNGMRASGTFAFDGRLELDTRRPQDVVTRFNVTNECRITATSADVAPRRFRSTWTRDVKDASGRMVQIQSGPGSLGWTPRGAISRHMETAVLICEDGAFFRHHGFDHEAITNSIRENLKAGRFVRGASTISMQLAKNLYLPKEKTVSRKLQEAVLTQLLEQELTKDEIMELYLNVIEFGPGIYGIGPAAAYYFNATPSQLSLGQALYLASILPNPKRQYFGADGRVTPGWSGYLRKLMHIAAKIHRVSEDELADALSEQVTFKVPYSPRLPREDEEGEVAGASGSAEPAQPADSATY